MTTKHDSLAGALAAFQASLPHIGKGNTANVKSDKGSYSYKYADLADISAVVLPLLAEHGMSFSAKPTMTDDGRFVLAYRLRHESGEDDAGIYPLPTTGTPQAIGSAISYARRYCLSAVTGVAPDEDDDGAAASHEPQQWSRPAQQRQEPRSGQQQRPAQQSAQSAAAESPADLARKALAQAADRAGVPRAEIVAKFAERYDGQALASCSDAALITAFTLHLGLDGAPAAATNGAAQ